MSFPPPDHDVSADVAAALIARFAPELVGEELGQSFEGWDNLTIRVGASHAIRMPRLRGAMPLIEVEQRWLPTLRLPVEVPVVVVAGAPSELFPGPWSIVRWVPGTVVAESPLSDEGAADLGAALAALHVPAPDEAPVCEWRATPLAARRESFAAQVAAVADRVDADAALAIYDAASALQDGSRTWVHADIHAYNLLSQRGRLSGIIDWGEMSAGDPLQDLGQAWVLLGERAFGPLCAGYGQAPDERGLTVMRGHAVDAATRMLSSALPGHHLPAARALAELGVMAAV